MTSKHIILTLLLMLCPIGMAAQSTITRHKPKPAVTKPKPAAKPKPKAKTKPAPRRNNTSHSGSTSSTVSLSAELNKLINNMVYVSGGTFIMGGDESSDQTPTHSVTLSSYYICKYEVTQALWRAVMGSNPSKFKGDNLPVEQVSWNDCQTFINRLNNYTGRNFRLPTEAEWEFAARGGNYSRHYKYSGSNYISDVAWYCDNSGNRTHPVGTKQANELGLYDMSGNVWEWCSDRYGSYSSYSQSNPTGATSGFGRVERGGNWCGLARYCCSSHRSYYAPGNSFDDLGLRLVLSQL
ncbi:formylglycine-generating enzyme family protein [Prevotellamassilia timonensis]|uniref:formylglycine-generating enzyme family protein n=1 Tax=Prevotellamassilia timonensis TaxID=1852370 RepID=UPI0040267C6D